MNALRQAKASWKERRSVAMSAHLVERDPQAYQRLAQVPSKYPDITVKVYGAEFISVLPKILSDIPRDAFAFFLMDPKGWRIPLASLAPMLARRNSEVIFNFMFDFINRAASIKDANVAAGLDELIPYSNWREILEAEEQSQLGGLSPERRKAILVDAFASNLAHFGGYQYVAETTVLRPLRDRPLYCLFYATRHEKGIEVFRDCQADALKEQSVTRAATKLKYAEAKSGQGEIFQSLHDMGPDDLTSFQQAELVAAEQTLLSLVPEEPKAIIYDRLWPQILARHVARRTDVNQIAARLRKDEKLLIPDWERGKRVPQSRYRIMRPKI